MKFAPDIEEAVEKFAAEEGIAREEALARLIRDWLIGHGYLPINGDSTPE